MATLQVELVAVERMIWSGEASMVIARTTEGELGVLPGHAPLLGELAPGGVVRIRPESGDELIVAAHGGFLSLTERGVSILAETAEISTEIDVEPFDTGEWAPSSVVRHPRLRVGRWTLLYRRSA